MILQEHHEESEANEDHHVHILKRGVVVLEHRGRRGVFIGEVALRVGAVSEGRKEPEEQDH